jgi:predicted membrane-bound spermidine synthase
MAMSSLASPTLVFIVLFFISGFLVGFEFTLASKIYVSQKGEVGEVAGTLYFTDLLGAWLGGMFGSIMLLPVLGLFNTCLLVALLKLSSFLLLKK